MKDIELTKEQAEDVQRWRIGRGYSLRLVAEEFGKKYGIIEPVGTMDYGGFMIDQYSQCDGVMLCEAAGV